MLLTLCYSYKEFATMSGQLASFYTVKRTVITIAVLGLGILSAIVAGMISQQTDSEIEFEIFPILGTTAFLIWIILYKLKLEPSVLVLLVGIIAAYKWYKGAPIADILYIYGYITGSFISVYLLSFIVYKILVTQISRKQLNRLQLSYWISIPSALLTALILITTTYDLVQLLNITCGNIFKSSYTIAIVVSLTIVMAIPMLARGINKYSAIHHDMSVNSIFSNSLSSIIVISIVALPLPVISILKAANAGVDTAKAKKSVYFKKFITILINTLITLTVFILTSYLALAVNSLSLANEYIHIDIIVMCIVAILIFLYIIYSNKIQYNRNKLKLDKLLYHKQQEINEHNRALNDLELKSVLSENQLLHNNLEMKRNEAINIALSVCKQKEYLESLKSTIVQLKNAKTPEEKNKLADEVVTSINQRLLYELEVDFTYFSSKADMLHKDFTLQLESKYPKLTQQEKRLATLLRLGFSSKNISSLLNIAPKSVEINRYRLRQKLNLEKRENLVSFLQSL